MTRVLSGQRGPPLRKKLPCLPFTVKFTKRTKLIRLQTSEPTDANIRGKASLRQDVPFRLWHWVRRFPE